MGRCRRQGAGYFSPRRRSQLSSALRQRRRLQMRHGFLRRKVVNRFLSLSHKPEWIVFKSRMSFSFFLFFTQIMRRTPRRRPKVCTRRTLLSSRSPIALIAAHLLLLPRPELRPATLPERLKLSAVRMGLTTRFPIFYPIRRRSSQVSLPLSISTVSC